MRVSRTAYPDQTLTFNEWMNYIHKEVAKLRIPNAQK